VPTYSKFHLKDIDGRWFNFDHQQLGNSCTLASCKIAKEFYHNQPVSEEFLRGISTLVAFNATNQAISPLSQIVVNSHNWDLTGAGVEQTVKVLKVQPLPIANARAAAAGIGVLRNGTRNRPVLAGWLWQAGGGHFTVCVGPTRTDPNLLVILDPWYGIQYVNVDEAIGGTLMYAPIDPASGNAAGKGRLAAAITTA
jgi:hypothetical protein